MSDRDVAACPECDSARSLRKRHSKTPTWVCDECGARFETPKRRSAKKSNPPTGTERELLEADPDEIPGGDAR